MEKLKPTIRTNSEKEIKASYMNKNGNWQSYDELLSEVEKSYVDWQKERAKKKEGKKGAVHYKTGGVEPFDLFRSGGMLVVAALTSIIRYAFRCRPQAYRSPEDKINDMEKIIHYAEVVQQEFRKELEEGKENDLGSINKKV